LYSNSNAITLNINGVKRERGLLESMLDQKQEELKRQRIEAEAEAEAKAKAKAKAKAEAEAVVKAPAPASNSDLDLASAATAAPIGSNTAAAGSSSGVIVCSQCPNLENWLMNCGFKAAVAAWVAPLMFEFNHEKDDVSDFVERLEEVTPDTFFEDYIKRKMNEVPNLRGFYKIDAKNLLPKAHVSSK
jgi:hypothetical protein